jgi:hypothetical protein
VRTHALSAKQALQSYERGPEFLRHICNRKWKYVISQDETWVILTDVSDQMYVFHQREGQAVPESHTKIWKASHSPELMFGYGDFCQRADRTLNCSLNGRDECKILHQPYPEASCGTKHSSALPWWGHKVTVRMDIAGSHFCSEMTDWMKLCKKYILLQEWMINS